MNFSSFFKLGGSRKSRRSRKSRKGGSVSLGALTARAAQGDKVMLGEGHKGPQMRALVASSGGSRRRRRSRRGGGGDMSGGGGCAGGW